MSFLHSAIYGLIQGLTEFLPVSSSAHLTLLPFFTGWEDPGLAFDVALHMGTLIALFAYFWRDIVAITIDFVFFLRGEKSAQNVFPLKILVATVPGALIGLLFEKQAESTFRSPVLIAGTRAPRI
jgi:undecaprenyl-diphosphatase